jgi:DNA repair photolyase
MVNVRRVRVRNLVTPSAITGDFAVNPYIGCPHKCVYCYAACINYTGKVRAEKWGDFIDVKVPSEPINLAKVFRKKILFSSMTDAYNPYEERAGATRAALKALLPAEPQIIVQTKSKLVARDADLLKRFPKARVSFSFSTVDRSFQRAAEPYASTAEEKIEAMKILHDRGVRTSVFIAPLFPEITDVEAIIRAVKPYCSMVMMDSLNLRRANRDSVLKFVEGIRPDLSRLYRDIYIGNNRLYWKELRVKVREICRRERVYAPILF